MPQVSCHALRAPGWMKRFCNAASVVRRSEFLGRETEMRGCSSKDEIEAISKLPEKERAAAIMHFIYISTITKPEVDWETRLAPTWGALDERAKAFNIAILETWKNHPGLLMEWLTTVQHMTSNPAAAENKTTLRLRTPRPGASISQRRDQ